MQSFGLDVWLYRGADWYVPDPKGPHVDREAWTVKFEPKVMQDGLDGLTDGVVKLVGVSDDHDAIDEGHRRPPRRSSATRDGGGLAALLPRRHPPEGQQGRGGPLPGAAATSSTPRRSPPSATSPTTS